MNLEGKHVVVTGGSGFLGRAICDVLREKKAQVSIPRSRMYNLTSPIQALACISALHPDIVIHSAAYYGGIEINQKYPAKIYYDNLVMGANVIEACYQHGVKKFVGVGTACSYPGEIQGSLNEDDLWSGACHESVRCYGMTKKMMQIQCEAYKKQYGFNGIHLILTNLYGEWDSYNTERSHVVAALIRRFVEATRDKKGEVVVWGSGKPIREFLYVKDAARAIVEATGVYDDIRPLNIGIGLGTSIKELVDIIAEKTAFKGKVSWDASKPDGQMKKVLNVDRMLKVLPNLRKFTPLEEGIAKTCSWFVTNYQEAVKRW